jgi:hypothetical protein
MFTVFLCRISTLGTTAPPANSCCCFNLALAVLKLKVLIRFIGVPGSNSKRTYGTDLVNRYYYPWPPPRGTSTDECRNMRSTGFLWQSRNGESRPFNGSGF